MPNGEGALGQPFFVFEQIMQNTHAPTEKKVKSENKRMKSEIKQNFSFINCIKFHKNSKSAGQWGGVTTLAPVRSRRLIKASSDCPRFPHDHINNAYACLRASDGEVLWVGRGWRDVLGVMYYQPNAIRAFQNILYTF